jgi:hypothetical protein
VTLEVTALELKIRRGDRDKEAGDEKPDCQR